MTISVDTLTEAQVAKTIDHSLLRPELTSADLDAGLALARRYEVASVCIHPCEVPRAVAALAGSTVAVGTVVGFPHGANTTDTKVFEARRAVADGAAELDMVLNIGWLRSGRIDEVEADIRAVVEAAEGRLVKVIFENAYLDDPAKIRACQATEAAGAHFVKTSTGFAPSGATIADLQLMRRSTSPHIQVKAAGGVRTLDALIEVMNVGVTRIGATATEAIIEDFRSRKSGAAGGGAGGLGGGY